MRAKMKGVPKDELVLAEMIANVEVHEVKFQIGAPGIKRVKGRWRPHAWLYGSNACCAVGAYLLDKPVKNAPKNNVEYNGEFVCYDDFADYTGYVAGDVFRGNDNVDVWWQGEAEMIGHAYRVSFDCK